MERMEDDFVDLVVTSPPYDNLRDYEGFEFDFESIAKELYRIIKPGGVVVWVVNDATIKGSETGTSFKQALFFMECGFFLHDTMIYEKNGPAYPAHDKSNRYSSVFEYMFILSKGKPKTHNLIKDRKNRWGGVSSFGKTSSRKKDGTIEKRKSIKVAEYGYRFNIWKYNNGKGFGGDDLSFNHPASFPEDLARDHIITWSNEGDIVYDLFGGSGTTTKMAIILKRNWIMSDVSPKYCEIAKKRHKLAHEEAAKISFNF